MEKSENMTADQNNLTKICENIFNCKEQKRNLEIQLSEEKLRNDYILKRKDLLVHRAVVYLICILLLIELSKIMMIVVALIIYLAILVLAFFEIKMLLQILFSSHFKWCVNFAEKHHINTFQKDEEQSFEKIRWIEDEIKNTDDKLSELIKQRNILQTEEEAYKEKTIFNGVTTSVSGKFRLKKPEVYDDRGSLFEYYLKEEQYYKKYLNDLELQLHNCERDVIKIDDDFDNVKHKLFFSTLLFVMLIVVQAVFEGFLYFLTSIICFVVGFGYIFYLEKVCKRPILRYLVEHDSNLVKEYAFLNNMTPEGNKREQIMEEIEQCKKELNEVILKKAALDIS